MIACGMISLGLVSLANAQSARAPDTPSEAVGHVDEHIQPGAGGPPVRVPMVMAQQPAYVFFEVPQDVEQRFEQFRRDLENDFGINFGIDYRDRQDTEGSKKQSEPAAHERIGSDLVKRLEGTSLYRFYERAYGFYGRMEGLYERIEVATRWAGGGLEVDPDFEAAVDGRVRLHLNRRVRWVRMGLDVDDAMQGKFGLRLSGNVRGYRLNFDMRDIEAGRVGFGLRRIVK